MDGILFSGVKQQIVGPLNSIFQPTLLDPSAFHHGAHMPCSRCHKSPVCSALRATAGGATRLRGVRGLRGAAIATVQMPKFGQDATEACDRSLRCRCPNLDRMRLTSNSCLGQQQRCRSLAAVIALAGNHCGYDLRQLLTAKMVPTSTGQGTTSRDNGDPTTATRVVATEAAGIGGGDDD